MRARWFSLLIAVAAACGPTTPGTGNTDPCAGGGCAPIDAGYFGECEKCGQTCSQQSQCLTQGFPYDEPLPQCAEGTCRAFAQSVRIRFEVDTQGWTGVSLPLGSLNTRFVLRDGLDGSTLTCASLSALANASSSPTGTEIETSGKANLLAFDVTRVQAAPGSVITQPFLPVATGAKFLIWTELWSAAPDANTKLPTGMRLGSGCIESGPAVADIKMEDTWLATGATATSRTIRVLMPPPN